MRAVVGCLVVSGGSAFAGGLEEIPLGTLATPQTMVEVAMQPGTGRLALIARTGQNYQMILNGQVVITSADPLNSITLSPDGATVACVQKNSSGMRVNCGGRDGPLYEEVVAGSFAWSPDGKHFGYAARHGRLWFAVRDSQEGMWGDAPPADLAFSADSSHFFYIVHREDGASVVTDETLGPRAPAIKELTVSKRGYHMGYLAKMPSTHWTWVVDGKSGGEYPELEQLRLSDDGERFRCVASLVSRDTRIAESDLTSVVIVDGSASEPFAGVPLPPVFSGDGKHVIFQGQKPGPVINRTRTEYLFLSVDGRYADVPRIMEVDSVAFAPGGEPTAFVTHVSRTGTQADLLEPPPYTLVVHGNRAAPFAQWLGAPRFSPDGKRTACILQPLDANPQKRFGICVDGKVGDLHKRVSPPLFSPDSKHVAYAVEQDAGGWDMAIDGHELPTGHILLGGREPRDRWKALDFVGALPARPIGRGNDETADLKLPFEFNKYGRLQFFFSYRGDTIVLVRFTPDEIPG